MPKYEVLYQTNNDVYIKVFKDLNEANKFAGLIACLYPGQTPEIVTTYESSHDRYAR